MELKSDKIKLLDNYNLFQGLLLFLSVLTIVIYFPEDRLYFAPDSTFHYSRIEALTESLRNRHFPVYIDSDLADGYGYGARLFYSDFVLLPVALLNLFLGLVISYKIYVCCILYLSGFFTYKAVYKLFRSKYISALSSLLITFSCYKLYSLAYRGALGEYLSYLFIPIIVIGIYELIKGDYRKWYVFSIGFSLLLMSHLLTSLLTGLFLLPVLICSVKIFMKDKQRLKYLLLAGVSILILAAYGILPMFEQLFSNEFFLKTQSGWASPAQNKLSFDELIKGIFPSVTGNFKGIGALVFLPLFLRIFVRRSEVNKNLLNIGDFCLLLGLFLILLISNIAPWGRFPLNLLSVIQFPWRLLEYVTFFWSLAIAIYSSVFFEKNKSRVYSFCAFVLIQTVVLVIYASVYRTHNSSETLMRLPGLGAVEYLPLRLQKGDPSYWYLLKEGERVGMSPNQENISNYTHVRSCISFNIDCSNRTSVLELPLFYYKGYSAKFNGEPLPVRQSERGLVEVSVREKGFLIVDFTGTFIQRYSFHITCFGFLFLLIYMFQQRKKKI